MEKDPEAIWTEEERRPFRAYYHYFMEAFLAQKDNTDILPEEALLLWLELYSFRDLGQLTGAQLKKTLTDLWEDVRSVTAGNGAKVQTKAEDVGKGNLLCRMRGKSAYSFFNRKTGQSVRLVLKPAPEGMTRADTFSYYQACEP